MEIKMNALRGLDIAGKKILFRPDINSPIDPVTKKIVNENRLKKNAVTLKYMLENGAAVALIAHQGDTQDYQNLIPLEAHAEKLSDLTVLRSFLKKHRHMIIHAVFIALGVYILIF